MVHGHYKLLIATVAVAAAFLSPGGSATAETAAGADSVDQHQAGLSESAARLEQAARRAGDGFAGLVLAPEKNAMTIYWAGSQPADLARAVADENGRGVRARLEAAKHSLADLLEAQSAIVSDVGLLEAGVVSTAPATDGSGLIVGHTGSEDQVRQLPSARGLQVPLILERQEPIIPATRWRDLTPFSGGAAIVSLTEGYYCSTGFAVRRPDGDRFMLTAAHCPSIGDLNSEDWITAGGATPYGFTTINRWSEQHDTAWIDEPNILTTYGPTVYMGGTDLTGAGTGERSAKVLGKTLNYNGDYVCTSGSFSGERCSIRIENNQITWHFEGPDRRLWTMAGVKAYRTDGGNAAGQGDSGGPVVKKSGSTSVYAQGIISAIQNQVRCTGVETFLGQQRYCGNIVYFGDINAITRDLNFAVVTS